MAVARTIKRHDTADPITGLATSDDQPGGVDLSIYDTVLFHARTADGALVGGPINEPYPTAGQEWVYEQDDADVEEEGLYDMELECTLSNGKKVHFPNAKAENPQLQIDPDLDDN